MRADDFFAEEPNYLLEREADPWADPALFVTRSFAASMVEMLRRGPLEGRTDLEAAIALTGLVHDELTKFGTDSTHSLTDAEIESALLALRAVTKRLGLTFEIRYRNFTTFRSYWLRSGASGTWQARRDLLEESFEPLHRKLIRMEEASLEALADPVSPRVSLGWAGVDAEILELRRRFQTASTPQDYRALGTNCVGVLEALSRTVYEPTKHLRGGETVPAADKTKQRLGRYIEDALPGKRNEDVRGLANKAIELAHHVKHSPMGSRREAGISADAVILLANILKRLDQDL